MEPLHIGRVLLDRCVGCGAVYFDAGELARHLEAKAAAEDRLRTAAEARGFPTSQVCPRCRSGLLGIRTHSGVVDVCGGCSGAVVAAMVFSALRQGGIRIPEAAHAAVGLDVGGAAAEVAGEAAVEVGATALEWLFEGIVEIISF